MAGLSFASTQLVALPPLVGLYRMQFSPPVPLFWPVWLAMRVSTTTLTLAATSNGESKAAGSPEMRESAWRAFFGPDWSSAGAGSPEGAVTRLDDAVPGWRLGCVGRGLGLDHVAVAAVAGRWRRGLVGRRLGRLGGRLVRRLDRQGARPLARSAGGSVGSALGSSAGARPLARPSAGRQGARPLARRRAARSDRPWARRPGDRPWARHVRRPWADGHPRRPRRREPPWARSPRCPPWRRGRRDGR